eukprot:COSAG05_NODE_493_length_9295_cov_27.013158_4_plen_87_part_00
MCTNQPSLIVRYLLTVAATTLHIQAVFRRQVHDYRGEKCECPFIFAGEELLLGSRQFLSAAAVGVMQYLSLMQEYAPHLSGLVLAD